MNTLIRQGNSADFSAVFSLMKEFSIFQQTPEKLLTSPEQLLTDQQLFKCFVAETDTGNIIGFASYFFAYYSWSGKALYLDDLYVQEAFRGTGTGPRLLEAVIHFAKQENCKRMRWLVSGWNNKAITFYEKMGAKIDRTDSICELELK